MRLPSSLKLTLGDRDICLVGAAGCDSVVGFELCIDSRVLCWKTPAAADVVEPNKSCTCVCLLLL